MLSLLLINFLSCLLLDLRIYFFQIVSRPETAGEPGEILFLFWSGKQCTISPICCRPNFTKFEHKRRSVFVCLLFFAGRVSAYPESQHWDLYIGPVRYPRERRDIGICVQCMCALCRLGEGTVGVSSLSCIFKCAPSRRGHCLANPGLVLIQCQPWLTLLQRLASGLSHICLLWLSRQRCWHLLIKALAMVTVYRGHGRILLLARD